MRQSSNFPIAVPTQKTKASASQKLHLAHLDGIRALAAIYVVFFHAFIQVEPNGKNTLGKLQSIAYLFTFGHQAVDVFIVVSGFCLMLPVIRGQGHLIGGAKKFFLKRARRILPPYFIAVFLTLFAIYFFIGQKTGTGWDVSIPVTTKGLITHLLLVQDIFVDTTEQINGAFWSISVEWRIYFLFPMLLLAWRKIGPVATLTVAVSTSYLLLYLLMYSPLQYNPDATVGVMPQYISLFVFGAFSAGICYSQEAVFVRLRQNVSWQNLMYLGLPVALVLCRAKFFQGKHLPASFTDLVVGIWVMALLIVVSTFESSAIRDFLSWKPLVFIGTFAYSIYLIHCPLQQIIWQYLLRPFTSNPLAIFILQCTLGTALIIGLSYCFFLVSERPFLRKPTLNV